MYKDSKILLIDDDEEDFLLTRDVISQIQNKRYHLDWSSNYDEGKKQIFKNEHDVYLIDYRLGNSVGLELIREAIAEGIDTPLIVLTGVKDSQIDEESEKAGAADYLVKGELTPELLDRSIRYCIAHAKILKQIRELNIELEKRVERRTEALATAIHELANSQQHLQKTLSRERELNELKSRFVTTASHEFRTPLATILSSISLVAHYDREYDSDKRLKHINRIKSAIANLTEILNDFLSIGKLEEGLVRNNPEEFEIVSFSKTIVNELKNITKENQQIILSHNTENVSVVLDKQLLKNIVINLLSNAIKYSPAGKNIEFKTAISEKLLLINIIDRGIGIPEEDQKHLFERFFRAKNSTNIQGTGLGLNIVKKYVDLMEGKISFISAVNEGATFTVSLPLRKKDCCSDNNHLPD
ncbi:MAG: hybrid sensor histidine kinase/response regulator [Bacteroidetes bacterium]|nr:hybrid sensor histidine kinase/response regulator [Bacteroidota bacterium]